MRGCSSASFPFSFYFSFFLLESVDFFFQGGYVRVDALDGGLEGLGVGERGC